MMGIASAKRGLFEWGCSLAGDSYGMEFVCDLLPRNGNLSGPRKESSVSFAGFAGRSEFTDFFLPEKPMNACK